MELDEKKIHKLKLACTLSVFLERNKKRVLDNKLKGKEDLTLVESLRKLESATGLSFTIIQSTFSAKRDISFSTLMTILDGLGLSISEFGNVYDNLTESDLKKRELEIQERKRIKD